MFRHRDGYVIGIDLGATNIKIGLIGSNNILSKEILPTPQFPFPDQLITAISCRIKDMLNQPFPKITGKSPRILGVGIGLPGLIDYKRGLVHFLPNIKGWRNVFLKRILQKRIGLPVFIDNDANLMCLAEARAGAARGKKNVIGITLGTGVGGGIIIDGALYRGTGFAAGEIGHIPINENGPKCNCQGIGCLERYIGNKHILAIAKRCLDKDISLERLSELANRGNRKAAQIWEEVAVHLGVALSGVVNLLNPEAIVVGGGVAYAGRVLFNKLRRVIKERAMPVQVNCVKILRARLGSNAGMIGAGLLVRENLYSLKY